MADGYLTDEQVGGASSDVPSLSNGYLTDEQVNPNTKGKPFTVDDYREEVGKLSEDPTFWDKPFEQKVGALRDVYLGPEQKGLREYDSLETENEVITLHKEILDDLRRYDGIPNVEPKDYLTEDPPDVSSLPVDKAYEALDAWEATTIAKKRAAGGLKWREIEDIAELQIADLVDAKKKEVNAISARDPEDYSTTEGRQSSLRNRGKIFLANVGQMGTSALQTGIAGPIEGAGMVLEQTLGIGETIQKAGKKLGRKLDTALPQVKPKDQITSHWGFEVNAGELASGAGSAIGTLGTAGGIGAVGKVAGLAPKVIQNAQVFSVLTNGFLASYAEGYDEVMSRTGSKEDAIENGLIQGTIEGVDSLVDLGAFTGAFSLGSKFISNKTKIKALTTAIGIGGFGTALETGLKIVGKAGDVAATMLVEGGSEVLQEKAQGEIGASLANDPTLRRTRSQLNAAFLAGAIPGAVAPFMQGAPGDQKKTIEVPPSEDPGEEKEALSKTAEEDPTLDKSMGSEEKIEEVSPVKPEQKAETASEEFVPREPGRRLRTPPEGLFESPEPQPVVELESAPPTESEPAVSSDGTARDAETRSLFEEATAPLSSVTEGEDELISGKRFKFRKEFGVNPESIEAQKDIKNVKEDADPEHGTTGKPGRLGEFSALSAGTIPVLEKDVTAGGKREVITGRNRLKAAKDSKTPIDIFVIKESEGFTIEDAKELDAQENIRDNRGKVSDYIEFFQRSKLTRERALEKGLLNDTVGERAFAIGTYGTPDLLTELKRPKHKRKINEEGAAMIAEAAPNDVFYQRQGLAEVGEGKSPEFAASFIRMSKESGITSQKAGQVRMFNDEIFEAPKKLAEIADRLRQRASDQLALIRSGKRLTEQSAEELSSITGMKLSAEETDPVALQELTKRLRQREKDLAPDKFSLHPEIMREIREKAQEELARDGKQTIIPAFEEKLKPVFSRESANPEGIGPAREEQFKESEPYTKAELTRDAMILAGTPELAPFSEEVREGLVEENAGEYLATSNREQEFFANRFLVEKDPEVLARDILNPETEDPLGALPDNTSSLVKAKILNHLDNLERDARKSGDTARAAALKDLAVEFAVTYIQERSGFGQALQIGNLNNQILGIMSKAAVLELTEDIINKGREKLSADIQRETIQVSEEADAVSQEEVKAQATQAELDGQQQELNVLRDKINQRSEELKEQQNTLREKRNELIKEDKKLQNKGKRQEKSAEEKVKKLEAEIAALEKSIEVGKQSLADAQARFDQVSKSLKADIKAYRSFERQLAARKKNLKKKELALRKKRAMGREKVLLRSLPAKVQGEIKALAERFEKAPVGSFVRQEIASQMINKAIEAAGGFSPVEIGMAVWYANALSGMSTQGINTYSSGLALAIRSFSYLARNPRTFDSFLSGMLAGMKRGATEAGSMIREGRSGRVGTDGKFSTTRALEALQPESVLEAYLGRDKGGFGERTQRAKEAIKRSPFVEIATAFGVGKFALRLMAGSDQFWYRTAFDAMVAAQLNVQGRQEGKTKEQIATDVSNALFQSTSLATDAIEKAETMLKETLGEGNFSPTDIARASFEILDKQLSVPIQKEADRFGGMVTFTNPPEGLFGTLANAINAALSKAIVHTRWGEVRLLQPFFPFVNIIANVAESGLEFSPLGFIKAGVTNPDEKARRVEIATNAVIGSAAAAVLVGIAASYSDDDDPPFAIYGSGDPLVKERKDQLKPTGWRPFTIKIGSLYVPYKETPLYWLATFGAYFDNKRWNSKFDEKQGGQKLMMMFTGVGQAFLDQSTLQGIGNIYSLLKGEKDPTDIPSSYLSNFLPGGAFARDLDRVFNAEYQETIPSAKGDIANVSSKFVGALFRNYPVVGESINRPLLSGFGEPIAPALEERFGFLRRTIGTWRKGDIDPEWKFLAENGLTFNGFKRTIEIGKGRSSAVKRKNAETKQKRAELIGRAYMNIFTPEERYEYVQFAGPKIKAAISKIMNDVKEDTVGGRAKKDSATLQVEIDKAVTKAKAEARVDFVSTHLR